MPRKPKMGNSGPRNATHPGLVRGNLLADVILSEVIELVPLGRLRPARVNDVVYRMVDTDDPAIVALGKDIKDKWLLEAIVATIDDVIVSGHRRRGGCLVAGLELVPVRRISIRSDDPRFADYLTSFNRQRVKSVAEMVREEVVRTSPEDAHNKLLAHRKVESAKAYQRVEDAGLRILKPTAAVSRWNISDVKKPMLDAASAIIEKYREYWPLTLRQVHYRMLNLNVFRNAATKTKYKNDQDWYKDLSDLLTRGRLNGVIPWEAMHDPTRPRTRWQQWENIADYTREQLDGFLGGYKRNLLQSQPAYIELVVEKITVQDIAERAASYFHVPVGVGRGYTSVTSLDETVDRFDASEKDRFIRITLRWRAFLQA